MGHTAYISGESIKINIQKSIYSRRIPNQGSACQWDRIPGLKSSQESAFHSIKKSYLEYDPILLYLLTVIIWYII